MRVEPGNAGIFAAAATSLDGERDTGCQQAGNGTGATLKKTWGPLGMIECVVSAMSVKMARVYGAAWVGLGGKAGVA